jgi:hypothetical protein
VRRGRQGTLDVRLLGVLNCLFKVVLVYRHAEAFPELGIAHHFGWYYEWSWWKSVLRQ